MTSKFCFATQGELINLAYSALGLLPRKEAAHDDFDETKKKAIQRRLNRLVNEQGLLTSNLGDAVKDLSNILTGYLPNTPIMGAIGDVLCDLYEAYNDLVKKEGTYLDKQETLRYFISIKAVPLAVVSINRHLLRYRVVNIGLDTPADKYWYLPSCHEDGSVTFPLEKIMRWAYTLSDTSQTQFHYPGKNADSDSTVCKHNLENAVNWTRGVSVPSLAALIKNFSASFQGLAGVGKEIPQATQTSILTALVIARATTFVSKEVIKTYHAEYLADVCAQFREYGNWIEEDVNEFKNELAPVMARQATPEEAMAVWQHACADYWNFFYGKVDAVVQALQTLQDAKPEQPIRKDVVEALASKYGRFAVYTCLDLTERKGAWAPPLGFPEMLAQGFNLKKDPATLWTQIDEYASQLKNYDLEQSLCWMEPWLRAVYYYRKNDFKSAFTYYQTAFDNAKYRAGRYQYDLVNQYVEVAAKNASRRSFKKGIDWAQYLDIKVRWLRDDEPTEEKLDFVYYIMGTANYSHQL